MENEEEPLLSRPSVPAMDNILGVHFTVLDHGFVRVIDYMGNDDAIVQAARVSYGTGTKSVREDEGLIRYLMSHQHTTPFEMCEIKIHVKLPIFVARQWIRHRTANVNEYSARYSILDEEFFVPAADQLQQQSAINRQGRDGALSAEQSERVRELIRNEAVRDYANYISLLDQETGQGIARELARIGLGLNFYTQWYWKIDLHNLLNFLQLRSDPHAQAEIRAYAEVLLEVVKRWVPATFGAFDEYRLGAVNLSRTSLELVRAMLQGQDTNHLRSQMSRRELSDFDELFGMPSSDVQRSVPTN